MGAAGALLALMWGAGAFGLYVALYVQAMMSPERLALWLVPAAAGAAGVAFFSWTARKSLTDAAQAALVYAVFCGLYWVQAPALAPLLRKSWADRALAQKFPPRGGESEKDYCARLAFLKGAPDPELRLGAERRLERCKAVLR